MLRNLLYSIFFHIMFIALLFLTTIEVDKSVVITEKVAPLTISFLNENTIQEVDNIKTKNEDDRVKNLSIDEKVELYNKIKRLKEAEEKRDALYRKLPELAKKRKNYEKSQQENINIEAVENEFSYYYTPVYVAEDKVNTEEKRRLIENRLKREELRQKMRENGIVPNVDVEAIKKTQKIEDVIKVSQKPLVVKNKKEEKKEEKKQTENKEEYVAIIEYSDNKKEENKKYSEEDYNINIDEIITEISMADNAIDDKYKGLSEDQIFSEEDYKKLKEIEANSQIENKYMLSLREKRNIQRQIKGCYKMAILRSKKDSKAIVGLTIKVARDGIINMNDIAVNKISNDVNEKDFNIALDNAKSALVFCSPLRGLPAAKYRSWRQMTFIFDSNNLE